MKKELFDPAVLATLDKLSINEARNVAIDLAKKMPRTNVKQTAAAERIVRDLTKAPTATEISRIMYQVYLSGTGLGTVGSTWKKHFDNV